MKTQHTESPWKVVELPHKPGFPTSHEVQFGEDGECVAEWVHKKEDAKLIAAAPDLLEALYTARETISGAWSHDETDYKTLDKIDAAIKKATE
jgi:hypothetical protein